MADRTIDTGREANTGRDTPVLTETSNARSVPTQTTQSMQGTLREVSGRAITAKETTPVTQTGAGFESKPLSTADMPDFFGVPSLVQDSGVPNGVTPPRSFGSNPLGILADLFSSAYGRAPVESPQAPVVVGDASVGSSGGSNAGLFVLLAIVGIVGYFIYKRMKQ